jgi:hypothetical protein
MTAELPVIQELGLVGSPELRHAQQALRKLSLQLLALTEQHRRRPQQNVVAHQAQPPQQGQRVTRARVFQPPAADGFVHRARDLRLLQVIGTPPIGRFRLPAPLAVNTLDEHAVVLVATHLRAGVAHPLVGLPLVAVGPIDPPRDRHRNHLSASRDVPLLNGRENRRLDVLDFLGHFLQGPLRHLLADNPPLGIDTEQHLPAAMVQHGAQIVHGFRTLAGGLLELQRLGLAGSDELLQLGQIHHTALPTIRSAHGS